jgi:hypothetical protein
MGYALSIVFATMLLCFPAMKAHAALALNANDVKFLNGCGAKEEDIKVIPTLSRHGQVKVIGILHLDDKIVCSDIKDFKDTRDFLRVFTPPPSTSPVPPNGYDADFLTQDELNYINKINRGITEKLWLKH